MQVRDASILFIDFVHDLGLSTGTEVTMCTDLIWYSYSYLPYLGKLRSLFTQQPDTYRYKSVTLPANYCVQLLTVREIVDSQLINCLIIERFRASSGLENTHTQISKKCKTIKDNIWTTS